MCTLTPLGKFYGEQFLGLPGWGDRQLSRLRVQKTMVALFTTIDSTFHGSSALASLMAPPKTSSKLYFARVIPSIQTVLLSIGALEFKNLQYTFKNLLQPIYKMQGTFTNI